MNRLFVLACAILLCIGCAENKKQPTTATPPAAPPTPTQLVAMNYPSLPMDIVNLIGTQGDHIDVLFYNMPISMSRDGNADVQVMLSQISSQAPVSVAPCQAIGRIFFQGKGETFIEADLFFGENCNYYLFYKDNKPAYANLLLPDGIKLYDNLTRQYRK